MEVGNLAVFSFLANARHNTADAGNSYPKAPPPQTASAVAGSSLTPGPMVELIDTFLMKVPLAPLGLARLIAVTSAFTLAAIASSLKEALPTPA